MVIYIYVNVVYTWVLHCLCLCVSFSGAEMKTIEHEMCCNQKRRQDTSTDQGRPVYISPLYPYPGKEWRRWKMTAQDIESTILELHQET